MDTSWVGWIRVGAGVSGRLRTPLWAALAAPADPAAPWVISQRRVSAIERGDIDRSDLTTLRTYIQALGGHIVAQLDEITTQRASPPDTRGVQAPSPIAAPLLRAGTRPTGQTHR